MSTATLRTFRFHVWDTGSGAECLSGWSDHEAQGTDKADAQRRLAKELGCCLSYLDEGDYCQITEVTT